MDEELIIETENTVQYALNIAEDGRILSATFPQYASSDAKIVDGLPEGDITDYLYHDVIEDGEVVGYYYDYVPVPVEEIPEEPSPLEILEAELMEIDLVACELYENQLAQEEINAAQDEALCDLYELMLGGE